MLTRYENSEQIPDKQLGINKIDCNLYTIVNKKDYTIINEKEGTCKNKGIHFRI